jgi:hypothetical protein
VKCIEQHADQPRLADEVEQFTRNLTEPLHPSA